MGLRSVQAPSAVIMVRPHHFANNPETALDNLFQRVDAGATAEQIAERAMTEFDGAVAALAGVGVSVHVFEDVGSATPNSIFPNNWFSTHHELVSGYILPNKFCRFCPELVYWNF